MRSNKVRAMCSIVVCISILQASCAPSMRKDEQVPLQAGAADTQPQACGDPLIYFSKLTAQTNGELSKTAKPPLSMDDSTNVCRKFHKAIFLSMPDNEQQDDVEALKLLQELERTGALSGHDLLFNNMLLRHISQRQDLRAKIAAQNERLDEVEIKNTALLNRITILQSQLDQLKNIEVEIDKKERSLTNPSSE